MLPLNAVTWLAGDLYLPNCQTIGGQVHVRPPVPRAVWRQQESCQDPPAIAALWKEEQFAVSAMFDRSVCVCVANL